MIIFWFATGIGIGILGALLVKDLYSWWNWTGPENEDLSHSLEELPTDYERRRAREKLAAEDALAREGRES